MQDIAREAVSDPLNVTVNSVEHQPNEGQRHNDESTDTVDDDYDMETGEPCSPLQSKAGVHKLCAIYFLIKNLPERFQSKLKNIYLVCLCYSDDINKTLQADFNNIWQMVVEDLQQLELEGIDVDGKKIRGTIALPSFDNLGANVSSGFAGSFSADYYCRLCECSSKECRMITEEIESKNRTIENYSIQLKAIESMVKVDYRKTLGVRRYCVLNDLNYFHITKNISVDILHDFYEGVVPFLLKRLFQFIIDAKVVTKSKLIDMVSSYNYGELNQGNIPSALIFDKKNLGQNGAQSKCLFLHVPFILEKYRQNDKLSSVWDSVESLHRILQVVHSVELNTEDLDVLQKEVSSHLNTIKTNFDSQLIAKHHNLVHYVRVIKSMGPTVYMNTIRFESKHKVFKDLIHSSRNFKNLCKTLAIRHQQNMAISSFSYKDEISFGYRCVVTIDDCEDDDDLVRIVQSNESVFETKHFFCNDTDIEKICSF